MVVIAWTRTILGDGAGSTVVTSRPDTFHGAIDGNSLKLNDATNQIVLDADAAVNKGTLTMAALTGARTWTLPDATTTFVGTDATQTLTNKTLTNPLIAALGPDADSQHTMPNVASDTVALLAATQTLSGKTINSLVTDNSASRITGQNRFRHLNTMVQVTKSATQEITGAAGSVAITFDTEDFDTDGLHDNATNNSRLTAQIPGKYWVYGYVHWGEAFSGVVVIRKNGTTEQPPIVNVTAPTGNNSIGGTVGRTVDFAATDFVELMADPNGTVNIAASTRFGMFYIGE